MTKYDQYSLNALATIEEVVRTLAVTLGARWSPAASELLKRHIAERLGGTQIYIPQKSMCQRSSRDEKIRADFDGTNVSLLARAHNLSERTVRRILAKNDAQKDI